uniref:uncharacterized protein LOC132674675 isoform X2 n=1 Tax=Panthera onca TaxID=9690 RepID=UPI002955CEA7|nr:uncharacterized protein LOC132674675 isoform X2 [Panthera onca]
MAINPMARVLVRDKRETETQRRSPVKTQAETGGTQTQAQGRLEPRRLEEAGRALPWSLWREHGPSWISVALPCLDLCGPALPGSQWSCPSWISEALPLLDLTALPHLDLRLGCPELGGIHPCGFESPGDNCAMTHTIGVTLKLEAHLNLVLWVGNCREPALWVPVPWHAGLWAPPGPALAIPSANAAHRAARTVPNATAAEISRHQCLSAPCAPDFNSGIGLPRGQGESTVIPEAWPRRPGSHVESESWLPVRGCGPRSLAGKLWALIPASKASRPRPLCVGLDSNPRSQLGEVLGGTGTCRWRPR